MFSIIIPLYNKASYIKKAINSVLAQTFNEFEVIVINDGSTDNSLEEASQIVDSRLKIITQENSGVSIARNNGVKQAKYPYICFLDADDWWEPTFLEEMHQLIEHYPYAGIYGTNYYIVKNGKNRIAPIGIPEGFKDGEIDYCQVYAKTLCMPLTSISICIPKSVFDEEKGFKPTLKLGEDFDLWIRVAIKHKVVFLNKPLAFYNQDVDVKWRAIGKLYPPETQFAFNTEHLQEEEQKNKELKFLIDIIRITCLKAYYLNKKYRPLVLKELKKVNIQEHKNSVYAAFLFRPIWITKTINIVAFLYNKISLLL
ncbi:MAG: glycosyltransferase family 2 protein [Porphyromonadaceae bacterium]|nr:glycosyltransferase family 2 protein [Porphyromonadaceae bacterium]